MGISTCINIVIVDDHVLFANFLSDALVSRGFKTIAIVKRYDDLHDVFKLELPDLVMFKHNDIEIDKLLTCKHLSQYYPTVRPVILSLFDDKLFEHEAFKSGAKAYFNSATCFEELVMGLKMIVINSKTFLSTTDLKTSRIIIKDYTYLIFRLSKRELEIVKMIRKCYSSQEIANELFISLNTVEKHRGNIFKKLSIKNAQSLVSLAIANNL